MEAQDQESAMAKAALEEAGNIDANRLNPVSPPNATNLNKPSTPPTVQRRNPVTLTEYDDLFDLETPLEPRSSLKQLVIQTAVGAGVTAAEAGKIVGRVYEKIDNFTILGKTASDLAIGYLAGKGTQMAVRAAFQAAIGLQGGVIVGAVAGGVTAGVKETIMEVRRQHREAVAADPAAARRNLKEKWKNTNKTRLTKTVGRSMVFGAIGGALGAEFLTLLKENPELVDKVKGFIAGHWKDAVKLVPGIGSLVYGAEAVKSIYDHAQPKLGIIEDEYGQEHLTTGALVNKPGYGLTWYEPGKEPVDVSDMRGAPPDTPLYGVPADHETAVSAPEPPKVIPTATPTPIPAAQTVIPPTEIAPTPPVPAAPAIPAPGSEELPTPQLPTAGSYQKLISLHPELKPDAPAAAVGRVVNQPGSADLSVQLTNRAIKTAGLDEKVVTPKVWNEIQQAVQHKMEMNTQGHFDNVAKEILEGKKSFDPKLFDPNTINYPSVSYLPTATDKITDLSNSGVLPHTAAEEIIKNELMRPPKASNMKGAFDILVAIHPELANAPAAAVGENIAVADQIAHDAIVQAGIDPSKIPPEVYKQIKDSAQHDMEYSAQAYYDWTAEHVLENPKIDPKLASQIAHNWFTDSIKPDNSAYGNMKMDAIDKIQNLVKQGTIPGVEPGFPKDLLQLPEIQHLPDGSNPWNVTKGVLTNYLHREPTNEEIANITKIVCRKSDIMVPDEGWKIPGTFDTRNLWEGKQVGKKVFKGLIFDEDVKKAMMGLGKNNITQLFPAADELDEAA